MGIGIGADMYILIFISIPNLKNRVLPILIPIPGQCGDSSSKSGRIQKHLQGWVYLLSLITNQLEFDGQTKVEAE